MGWGGGSILSGKEWGGGREVFVGCSLFMMMTAKA